MSYYPIFIDLQGKKAIVVGGGTVAQRKIETLLEYGAVVHVIARQLTPTRIILITDPSFAYSLKYMADAIPRGSAVIRAPAVK